MLRHREQAGCDVKWSGQTSRLLISQVPLKTVPVAHIHPRLSFQWGFILFCIISASAAKSCMGPSLPWESGRCKTFWGEGLPPLEMPRESPVSCLNQQILAGVIPITKPSLDFTLHQVTGIVLFQKIEFSFMKHMFKSCTLSIIML